MVGGGVIGLEFATVYTRVGAKVLVVERCRRFSPGPTSRSPKRSDEPQEAGHRDHARDEGRRARERAKRARDDQRRGHQRQGRDARVRHGARRRRPPTGNRHARARCCRAQPTRKASSPSIAAAHEGIEDLRNRRRHRAPLLAHRAMKQGVVAAEVIGAIIRRVRPGRDSELRLHRPEVATVGLSEEEAKATGYEVRSGSSRSPQADARGP